MKRTLFAFTGLVLAFAACVRGTSPSGGMTESEGAAMVEPVSAAPFTDAMVQEGQEIYGGVGICAACHGPDGSGAIGPNLTDDEWLIGDGEYEEIVDRITNGVSSAEATFRRGATMPPRGGGAITEDQVRAVAAYIYALSH